MKKMMTVCVMLLAVTLVAGCVQGTSTRAVNAPGTPTQYRDPGTPSQVQGVGLESQDIVSMCDKMLRDMLANPTLAGRPTAPRVIVDAEYFTNEGSSRINKNMITDRLRIELTRAANGRMVFVGRHVANMVESERALKREGVTDQGTKPTAAATAGGDFRMSGRITTLDSVDKNTGTTARFHQIVFEMVDLETGVIVWGGMYDFKKEGADDVVYQ
jgi:PBP1b-binding outer membrane lipoprotein LpoB